MNAERDSSRLKRGMRGSYDLAGERYARFIAPIFEPIALRVITLASLSPDDRYVDLATGSGALIALADGRPADVVAVGVDQSRSMLSLARAGAPSADLVQGDLEELPFGTAVFEVATLALALHHLPDPYTALREARRIVRPGGRLAVAAWDHTQGPLWMAFDEWFEASGLGPARVTQQSHRPIDTVGKLRQALEEAGFKAAEVSREHVAFAFRNLAHYWDWRTSFPATYRVISTLSAEDWRRARDGCIQRLSRTVGPDVVRDDRSVLFGLAR